METPFYDLTMPSISQNAFPKTITERSKAPGAILELLALNSCLEKHHKALGVMRSGKGIPPELLTLTGPFNPLPEHMASPVAANKTTRNGSLMG